MMTNMCPDYKERTAWGEFVKWYGEPVDESVPAEQVVITELVEASGEVPYISEAANARFHEAWRRERAAQGKARKVGGSAISEANRPDRDAPADQAQH